MAKSEDGLKKLKDDLTAKAPGRLYLFWGEEDYLRTFYTGRIRNMLLPAGLEEFNDKRFSGKTDPSDIREAIDALPVFSERTVVEVQDFDVYKCAADLRDQMEELLSDLPDYCCLILSFTDPDFKPDARTKIHATIKENGAVVEFKKQGQSDLVNWVRRRFGALDKEISLNDAEYLIFHCGSLMTGLISEIEKIGAYAKDKKITRADIDAVGTPVLDAVVFRLTDALAQQDNDRAARLLSDLLAMREHPIMLLAAIGRQCRQILTARLALDSGQGSGDIQKLWSMRSAYPARLIMDAAKRRSRGWCVNAVRLCAEYDYKMKSTGIDGEALIRELFVRLASGETNVA